MEYILEWCHVGVVDMHEARAEGHGMEAEVLGSHVGRVEHLHFMHTT